MECDSHETREGSLRSFAEVLLSHRAVAMNIHDRYDFVSGLKSPIHVDTRHLISHRNARRVVTRAMKAMVHDQFQGTGTVVGIATAGIPWAAWLAEAMDLPLLYVRPAPKERGLGKGVEGDLQPCKGAILVEDLVTTGFSSARGIKALHDVGLSVVGVLSIFSYEAPFARQRFQALGIDQASVTGLTALFDFAPRYFSPAEVEALRAWQVGDLAHFVPKE